MIWIPVKYFGVQNITRFYFKNEEWMHTGGRAATLCLSVILNKTTTCILVIYYFNRLLFFVCLHKCKITQTYLSSGTRELREWIYGEATVWVCGDVDLWFLWMAAFCSSQQWVELPSLLVVRIIYCLICLCKPLCGHSLRTDLLFQGTWVLLSVIRCVLFSLLQRWYH